MILECRVRMNRGEIKMESPCGVSEAMSRIGSRHEEPQFQSPEKTSDLKPQLHDLGRVLSPLQATVGSSYQQEASGHQGLVGQE